MFLKKKFFVNIFALIIVCSCTNSKIKLPIISTAFIEKENIDQIDLMSFTNQYNEKHNTYSLKGKVHLVNFFFISCTSICPIMENNLKEVILSNKDVPLLSFTIDPERDSISVLRNHHKNFAEDAPNWFFIRSNKKDLKKIAKLYLSNITNKQVDESSFYHSSSAVLLDKQMRIRGVYDVLDEQEIALLKRDIELLIKE